jgi:hypothetical protein
MLSLPCAQLPNHTRLGTSAEAKSSGVIAETNGMYDLLAAGRGRFRGSRYNVTEGTRKWSACIRRVCLRSVSG